MEPNCSMLTKRANESAIERLPAMPTQSTLEAWEAFRQALEEVKAIECKLAGVWHYDGKPYLPDSEEVEALLPYHYRKAFNRTRVWWAREFSDVVRVDLHDLRGFPLGTIHATLTGKKS